MSYRVRTVDPSVAGAQLRGLWARNLGSSCHDPQRRLDWFYLENPAGLGTAHLLESDTESTPVGCMGIGIRRYTCEGRSVRAALLGDLAVDRRHRSLGPALALQRATRTFAQENFPLALGYPNEKALPSLLRLGFHELGRMVRYAAPLRYGGYVRRHLPEPFRNGLPKSVMGVAGLVLDAATSARDVPAYVASGMAFRLETLTTPDLRFDDLWTRARPNYRFVAERSSAFLTWRFLRKPGPVTCRFMALTRRSSRRLVAYAIVEPEGQTAYIRDLFGETSLDIAALLERLSLNLRFAGFASMSLGFFGAPWLLDLLTQHHFHARDNQAIILDWGTDAPAAPETLLAPSNWYLTQADEDG